MERFRFLTSRIISLGALSVALSAPSAFAAPTAPDLDFATTFASLIFVILVILVLAWLLKRMQSPMFGQQKGLKIISQLPVGTKERIAVVEAGEEQFLVGITSQSIQLISKLEKPLSEESVQAPSFANQFSQLIQKHEKVKKHEKE